MTSRPSLKVFFDEDTSTFSYVVHDSSSPLCAIIDPVLDYDAASARTSTHSAQAILDYISTHNLEVEWILETHAHADHLSAAAWLKEQRGGKIAIGSYIDKVQHTFKAIYNLADDTPLTSAFDVLLEPGKPFTIGQLEVDVLHVPGHTPADMAYHVKGLGIFVGDTLFMPDGGTARCDFPGGDARQMYRSIQKILSFPKATSLFFCHDYPPADREPSHHCTVQEQRFHNIHVRDGISEDEFVSMRQKRDATLSLPRLMLPALQVNIRAGHLPDAEDNGQQYLKIPLNRF